VVSTRAATALVGLLASLAVSVLVYRYTGQLLVFLVVPFVPLLFRGLGDGGPAPDHRSCPACGYATSDPETRFCPRDGTELD